MEELTIVFCATGCADGTAKVTVQFEGAEGGMRLGVEGVDIYESVLALLFVEPLEGRWFTLGNDAGQIAHAT